VLIIRVYSASYITIDDQRAIHGQPKRVPTQQACQHAILFQQQQQQQPSGYNSNAL